VRHLPFICPLKFLDYTNGFQSMVLHVSQIDHVILKIRCFSTTRTVNREEKIIGISIDDAPVPGFRKDDKKEKVKNEGE